VLPTATVTSYYRVLRQAGLVTKRGRGRSAAKMSAEDVAKLLITLMGADSLEEAPPVCGVLVQLVSPLVVSPEDLAHIGFDRQKSAALSPDQKYYEPDENDRVITFLEGVVILLEQIRHRKSQLGKDVPLLPIIRKVSNKAVLEVSSKLEARIIDGRG